MESDTDSDVDSNVDSEVSTRSKPRTRSQVTEPPVTPTPKKTPAKVVEPPVTPTQKKKKVKVVEPPVTPTPKKTPVKVVESPVTPTKWVILLIVFNLNWCEVRGTKRLIITRYTFFLSVIRDWLIYLLAILKNLPQRNNERVPRKMRKVKRKGPYYICTNFIVCIESYRLISSDEVEVEEDIIYLEDLDPETK